VLKTGVIEFPTGRCTVAESRPSHHESADNLPDLPVLPETLLAMELQLQSSSVELRAFTAAVQSDLGATLQILRMAAREYGTADDRPIRIEDCICDFGPAACFDAVANGVIARGFQRRIVMEIWTHAREIAANAKQLAEAIPWAISPDQAYLAGMLHAIGSLPAALGWGWSEASHDRALTGLKLAERWAFPGYLRDFFCEMLMPGYDPQWSEIMAEAHRLAGRQMDCCAMCDAAIRPSA
jgi:HD-like signal output (HDOD) protein